MLWLLKVSLLLAGITCTRRVIATALPNTDVQPKQAAAVAMADPIAKLLASADYLSPRVGGGGGQKENEIVMNPSEVGGEGNRNAFALWPSSIVPDEAEAGFEPALDDDLANEKRATWNSFQGSWGKRAAGNWNKLSAAWGKRRPPAVSSWNNLSGMWGKRAKWNELSGMWGKRAWNDMSGGWGKKKRAGPPHWNKLRGMWGKRNDGQAGHSLL